MTAALALLESRPPRLALTPSKRGAKVLRSLMRGIGLWTLLVSSALLGACGGGGSSGDAGAAAPPVVTTPVVTTQPASQSVATGVSVTFSVVATGNGLGYQWQRSTTGGVSWQDIGGATTSSYTVSAVDATMNGHQYHVIVGNVAGVVVSEAAMLTVASGGSGGGGGVGATTAVAAGANHSVALKSDGSVLAWGSNNEGALGFGSTQPSTFRPTRVTTVGGATLTGVVALSAGPSHTLALRSDRSVYAWGSNSFGQLGDGTATSRNEAVAVRDSAGNLFGDVAQISAGQGFSVAVKSDGSVWVWGWHAYLFVSPFASPTPLLDRAGNQVRGVAKVDAGPGFALLLKTDGSLWTWGSPAGSDASQVRAEPINTALGVPITGIAGIAAGRVHALALTTDGRVLSWGSGEIGRTVGLSESLVPGFVTDSSGAAFTGVAGVQAGDGLNVLTRTDGSLWAFGGDTTGLAAGTINLTFPAQVRESGGAALGNVSSVSFRYQHALFLRQDGSVWGWGRNANEQLAKEVRSPADYIIQWPTLVLP